MRSIAERVRYIYENVPDAQSDPKVLLLIYWQLFDEINIPDNVLSELINKATLPETIARTVRDIKSDNKYLARQEIEEKLAEVASKIEEEE